MDVERLVYYSPAVSRNSTLTYLEATLTGPLLFSRSAEAASTARREIAQCLEAYSNCFQSTWHGCVAWSEACMRI